MISSPLVRRGIGFPLVIGGALGALGCASLSEPCAGAQGCPIGRECLASRCAAEGGVPVPPRTRRVRLGPSALGLAAPEPSASMPSSVTLGARVDNERALYMRFPASWRGNRVRTAFLLLEPRAAALTGSDVLLEVGCVRQDWRGSALAWNEQPGLVAPFSRGIARAAPPLPVRVDVTELVRFWAAHPERDFGLGVRANGTSELGVALATGLDGGMAPRLDVYLED
jgi:hypothetical protein